MTEGVKFADFLMKSFVNGQVIFHLSKVICKSHKSFVNGQMKSFVNYKDASECNGWVLG